MTSPSLEFSEQGSEALIEVMEAITLHMVNMAAVVRLPETGSALLTLIGCRMVELLEIYVRRVLELIFAHDEQAWSRRSKAKLALSDALHLSRADLLARARQEDAQRIAGKFEDAQPVLQGYLNAPPFSTDELQQFLKLKDVRNLLVHNNGRVDVAYARKYPECQVGDIIDPPEHVLYGAFIVLQSVRHIDGLLLQQYPALGQPLEAETLQYQARMRQALQMMNPERSELHLFQGAIAELRNTHPAAADLLPEGSVFGHQTFWLPTPVENAWSLVSIDGRMAWLFTDQTAALLWLETPIDWTQAVVEREDSEWITGRLSTEVSVKWPRAEWGKT